MLLLFITAGYQNASILTDLNDGENVSYRMMNDRFKSGVHLNPILGMTKGQFQTQIENDINMMMRSGYEYPTEAMDRSDDITNYDHWRSVHRSLANQQLRSVSKQAGIRKLELEKGLNMWHLDTKRVHKVIKTGIEMNTVVLIMIGNGKYVMKGEWIFLCRTVC